MASITIENVWKLFGKAVVVPDLNLKVNDGEFLVCVGPSGCGKTTTLRMLAGLETPSYGRILFDNDDVTTLPPGRRDIAMVFQSYALYPHLSVYKNLSFGLEVRGEDRAGIEARVKKAAETVGLESYLDRQPSELSGGQRQRVALARSLVREPRIFLLDEPLSNLDASLRTHMRSEISDLQRRLGVTTVYVTHDQVEAMSMGHRIAVFDRGRILQVDTPSQLYLSPANKKVGLFIGSPKMNILPAESERSGQVARLRCLGSVFSVNAVEVFGSRSLPARVDLGLRPDDLHWTKDAPSRCVERLSGIVKGIETTGSETFVLVTIGNTEVNAKFPSFAAIKHGQQVDLVFDPSDLHFFDTETGNSLRETPTASSAAKAAPPIHLIKTR